MSSAQDLAARPVVETKALRINDFCRAYGVGRSTAYSLINTGKVKSALIGKRRVILQESAEQLLKSGQG
jgi:predicted DNA-binding transcriptional regulator AlpA